MSKEKKLKKRKNFWNKMRNLLDHSKKLKVRYFVNRMTKKRIEENMKLKQEKDNFQPDTTQLDKITEEYEKLKNTHSKLINGKKHENRIIIINLLEHQSLEKEYLSEKEILEDNIDSLKIKCMHLEVEVEKSKSLSLIRRDSIDSNLEDASNNCTLILF